MNVGLLVGCFVYWYSVYHSKNIIILCGYMYIYIYEKIKKKKRRFRKRINLTTHTINFTIYTHNKLLYNIPEVALAFDRQQQQQLQL